MGGPRAIFINDKWRIFAEKVKRRDGYRCLRCGRETHEVVLQVHHERYFEGKAPWEYALSDCLTLCQGCHAREHGQIEPDHGWTLLAITDLGSLDRVCERRNCGSMIRYAHETYHPAWGYKVVGSTCVQHLTSKERDLSQRLIVLYKNIATFVHDSVWREGRTQKGRYYLFATYRYHEIRIYGTENHYAYQLVLKEKGVKWHDYRDVIPFPGRVLEEVKEIAYLVLKGTLEHDPGEQAQLREIYRRLIGRG